MNDIRQRLLVAFRAESAEHLERIRAIVAALEGEVEEREVEEAFRRAHSLKGAARAVDLRGVEALAHWLETLFSRLREGELDAGEEVTRLVDRALDAIEDQAAVPDQEEWVPGAREVLADIETALSVGRSDAAVEARPVLQEAREPMAPASQRSARAAGQEESVRVSAASLDRLVLSTGELQTENMRQDLVGQELARLGEGLAALEREWEQVRQSSSASLRRMGGDADGARVSGFVNALAHRLRDLAAQQRRVRQVQQRGSWSLRHLAEQVQEDVRQARLVPAESVFSGFRKMMRDLARDQGKELEFAMRGLEVEADRMVLQVLKDPLMHLLRNALSHGIETPAERRAAGKAAAGKVVLRLGSVGNRLRVWVEDDGRGIDLEAVRQAAVERGRIRLEAAASVPAQDLYRVLFQPGFSTTGEVTELAGRGMGLSVVQEAVTRLQGELEVQPGSMGGTAFVLTLPLSFASHRLLLVEVGGQIFGLPVHGVERLYRVRSEEVESVEGQQVLALERRTVPLVGLGQLLGLEKGVVARDQVMQVVVLRGGEQWLAAIVDRLVAIQEGLVKNLGGVVQRESALAGGFAREDGSVVLVLNPAELVEKYRQGSGGLVLSEVPVAGKEEPAIVLVVDDSITTRTLERSILEAQGYRVLVAVDGVEALEVLRREKVDLVVSDVQMPRLDGLALLEAMKKDEKLSSMPFVLVTSLASEEDQKRGLELGADAYIVKQRFDQRDWLDTIEQLL